MGSFKRDDASTSRRSTSPTQPDDDDEGFETFSDFQLFFGWLIGIVLVVTFFVALMFFIVDQARAHEHPPEHAQLHNEFYKDLKQPNNPSAGCCNDQDCYPTRARFDGVNWWAVRREDGKWLKVPTEKVNAEKSPDGQAHLCAFSPHGGDVVLCFVPPRDHGT
jgi:hypothetical protein